MPHTSPLPIVQSYVMLLPPFLPRCPAACIGPALRPDHVLVSCSKGITLDTLEVRVCVGMCGCPRKPPSVLHPPPPLLSTRPQSSGCCYATLPWHVAVARCRWRRTSLPALTPSPSADLRAFILVTTLPLRALPHARALLHHTKPYASLLRLYLSLTLPRAQTVDEVLARRVVPPGHPAAGRLAFLSGPSFAAEVAAGQPAAVTVAAAVRPGRPGGGTGSGVVGSVKGYKS